MATVTAKQIGQRAKGRTKIVLQKVALDSFSEVILASPVDTGRFRGNWQVAVGSVPTGELGILDKTGQVAIGKVQETVASFDPGDVVTLVNNVPYAQRIEYGWSSQAPAGMVRIAAQRAQIILDRAIAELGE